MSSDYDYGSTFLYPLYGRPPETAEEFRAQAVAMLRAASEHISRAPEYLAAAQVHATLALTAPEAGVPSGDKPPRLT